MRIDELVLERYGAFEHRRLTLDGSGLTVVYGPNEAGKSTCLAAVGDFLFRIPEGTPRIARFGSDLARIGATLGTADGRRISLKRRYGRVRTLIDEAGTPCDDAVLATLLGATTRDRFENLFGLSHETLRRGGETLLRADGDIGRLIVEAGGGLRVLMGRLDSIDAEIDGLFAPRRKESRAFYKALAAYEAADKTAKSVILTRDTYERDRKAQAVAAAALAEARAGKRGLAEALSRLQRTERVIPALRALEGVAARLASYADVAGLADSFPDRWAKALAARDAVVAELAKARLRHGDLLKRRDAMVVDDALVAVEAEVRDIGQRVAVVSEARGDRANRTKEMADAEAALAVLRHRLRLGPADDLEPLMPPPDVLDAVRALAAKAAARQPKLENARETVETFAEAVRIAEAKITALAERGRAEPFGMDAATFASLPSEWAAGQQRLEDARRAAMAAQAGAAALGFADVAALRALAWPPDDQIRSELDVRNTISAERTRQTASRAMAEAQRDAATADMDRLRQGGEIATADVVADARRRRDEAWEPVRSAHRVGRSPRSEEERSAEIAAVEAAIAAADRLSDARVSEAQRVASLVEAERRAAEAAAVIRATLEAERRLDDALEHRRQAFGLAFPEACRLRTELPALLDFSIKRGEVFGRDDAADALRRESEHALQQLAPRIRRLEMAEARAGLAPRAEADLAERAQAVAQAIAAHDRAHADHQREEQGLAPLQSRLVTARRQFAGLEREQEAWAEDWTQAATALGVPPGEPPASASDLADRWRDAREELRVIAITKRRLAGMDENEADLVERIAAVTGRVTLALPHDPVLAGTMLTKRWSENDAIRLRRDELFPDLEGAAVALEAHGSAKMFADEALGSLAAEAGIAFDEAALAAAAARRREWTALRDDRAKLVATARGAGDGLDLAVLSEQAGSQDLDAVRAEIADLQGRLDALDVEIEDAIRSEQQAAAALSAHEGPSEATRAVVEREAATAEMHAAIERYVELTLARSLVTQAIKRVRDEQQDPLVRAAGVMFARMTRGEFDGVAADVDAKGAPVVVGIRAGSRAPKRSPP